jgi:diguanylate cyclase (GGDEF)-like protein
LAFDALLDAALPCCPRRSRRGARARFWLGLLALLIGLQALAQTSRAPLSSYYRESWTTREGLPHNAVSSIVQTPDGYLWLATWEGVARYSGHAFRNYDRNSGTGLPDSGVRALALDSEGGLLAGGLRGGLTRHRQGQWQALPNAARMVTRILEDSSGVVWAGTETAGLMRLDGSGQRQYFAVEPEAGGGTVYALQEDSLGRLWVGSSIGLARIERGRAEPAPGQPETMLGRRVMSLLLDRDGHLLVGGENGAYRSNLPLAAAADPDLAFEPLDPRLAEFGITQILRDRTGDLWFGTVNRGLLRLGALGLERLDTAEDLPNSRVLALFEDREGSLWVGTNGGLMRLGHAPFSTLARRQGLSDDYVRALIELDDGSLLIGTSQGLSRLQGERATPVTAGGALQQTSVLSLARSRQGYWVGTYTGGAMRVHEGAVVQRVGREQGLPSNEVRAMLESSEGRVWLGTTQGLARVDGEVLRVYRSVDGLPSERIGALHETPDGSLWIGTVAGLARLRDEKIEPVELGEVEGVESIFAISADALDGALWLATDRGLLRFDPASGRTGAVGYAAGLPFEKFFAAVSDGRDGLWLTGNRGVLRISVEAARAVAAGRQERLQFELFNEADGMQSAQCNGGTQPAALLRTDGSVWVATAIGAAHVDPGALDRFADRAPPVVIESVLADGIELGPSAEVALPGGTSRIEIGFAGIAFVMPQRVRYRYRLEGFDNDWVERGSQRNAVFTNLGPGEYTLRVQSAHPNGPWSRDEAQLKLSIPRQWWQQPVAWLVAAALLVLLTHLLLRRRMQRARRSELRLRELVEQRTADLKLKSARLVAADVEKNALLEQLRLQSEAFERQAREDSLTGLPNRRAFDELLAYEFARAGRSTQPLCVALIDLDHFKRINDELSHAAGDAVLRAVASRMRELCREVDTVSRWGGEEFALLLPNTQLSDALTVCERIRSGIERMTLDAIAPGLKITLSVGLASHEEQPDYDRMLSQADAALYAAKQAGRNRVAC